jgi:hypothetical protein
MFTLPRTLLVAFFALLALASMLVGSASARTYKTTIVVKTSPAFYGELKSPKGYCRYGRPVRLYLEHPGPDELITTDTTDSSGEFSLPIGEPELNPGSYYVQASPTGRCRPAKSRVVTI